MIIAKNDEDKRSRVWNYVTGGIFRKSAGRKVEA